MPGRPQVVWHGDADEANELVEALARNCNCEFDKGDGHLLKRCAGHYEFVNSQRFVDGLLFARRLRERFQKEEGEGKHGD